MLSVAKAHAYGNDFLFVLQADAGDAALDRLAQEMCARHAGVGADGLIVYEPTPHGASMRLFNADGSRAEVSGNGVRALGALLLRSDGRQNAELTLETDGGVKQLTRTSIEGTRQTFRAAMGQPADLRAVMLTLDGERLRATALSIGNPHCVLLGPLPDEQRFRRVGAALERHAMFPSGTNVEFAHAEAPSRLRIMIWERGVGPTSSSGTGSCAALVAAAAFGGAERDADVVAPGGAQRVEWRDEGVYLTGWAEIICEGRWLRQIPRTA